MKNKIKKSVALLLIFSLLFCSFSVVSAAEEYVSGNYTYTVSGSNATITAYPETAKGSVKIPSELNGYKVTAIDNSAFFGCTLVTEIEIPDTVKSIGNYTFAYCTSLTKITVPSSVTSIGNNAFKNSKDVVIYTPKDSTAYKYAVDNGVRTENSEQARINIFTYENQYCTYIGERDIYQKDSNLVSSLGIIEFDEKKITDISKKVTWSSSDENVLKIEGCRYSKLSNGKYYIYPTITAQKQGEVTITATTFEGNSTNWTVEVLANEYYLRVYASDAACSTYVGESIVLEIALFKNGKIVSDWLKPAVVIGNSKVIDISYPTAHNSYTSDYFRYEVTVTGLKEGNSSLTITDMNSGASVVITIVVKESIVGGYSYLADDVPSFYPDVLGDRKTQTNIYNCNDLYVNSYNAYAVGDNYHVSFDVYNESYMYGSVDVFNSSGRWIASRKIDKYEDIQSLFDTGKAAIFLIAELNKPISYTNHAHSVKTHISIDVPRGGYFTISNNYAQSPGAFIYNSVDYMMLAAETVIDVATGGVDTDAISQNVVEQALSSDAMMEIFMDEFQRIALSVSETALEVGYGEAASVVAVTAKEVFDSAGISVEGAIETVCGIAEGAFALATGFIGATLKGLFVFSKMSSYTLQTVKICNSVNKPYVTIHSPEKSVSTTINGVTVIDDDGAFDEETIMQVFKIHNDEVLTIALDDKEYGFGEYALYNICFVKNDKEVQPNGKVTVKIPIPEGYEPRNSIILREVEDGWEIIDAIYEDGFFVFEIDHFCLFAIVKNIKLNDVEIKNIIMTYKESKSIMLKTILEDIDFYKATFSSSNNKVATVDENGNVTATGVGTAEITVTVTDEYGNVAEDTCTVTVSYAWWQWLIIIFLFGWIWY